MYLLTFHSFSAAKTTPPKLVSILLAVTSDIAQISVSTTLNSIVATRELLRTIISCGTVHILPFNRTISRGSAARMVWSPTTALDIFHLHSQVTSVIPTVCISVRCPPWLVLSLALLHTIVLVQSLHTSAPARIAQPTDQKSLLQQAKTNGFRKVSDRISVAFSIHIKLPILTSRMHGAILVNKGFRMGTSTIHQSFVVFLQTSLRGLSPDMTTE